MVSVRLAVCLGASLFAPLSAVLAEPLPSDLAALGRMLFFDVRLSAHRNQSCASCHDPTRAFSDPGTGTTAGAVSVGSDELSIGDRNAPSLGYVSRIPPFHRDASGEYVGGLFVDGRATTLEDQVREPITNPMEMALPDATVIRERLLEDSVYKELFAGLLGPSSLATPEQALQSLATVITAFERSGDLAPFDSKYDRYLRGEAELTRDEELGRVLFFSNLVNCSQCHLLDRRENRPDEIFSSLRYHNIGVPANHAARQQNGLGPGHVDRGLLENPAVRDSIQSGRFRVPSLRNVAVTGPYMHNGVFRDLETAIVFYNRFLIGGRRNQINPETGMPWREPEVPDTVALELLGQGQPLTDRRVAQLIAFLETLTDRRYEHLLGR